MRITDIDGKTYLDAVSGGVWTVNVGYGRKEIVDAVAKQMMEMCYFANGIGNVPTIKFSEKLISKMPGMSRVYLSNSEFRSQRKGFQDRPSDRPAEARRQEDRHPVPRS